MHHFRVYILSLVCTFHIHTHYTFSSQVDTRGRIVPSLDGKVVLQWVLIKIVGNLLDPFSTVIKALGDSQDIFLQRRHIEGELHTYK